MSEALYDGNGLMIDTYAGPDGDRPRTRVQISCYQPDTGKFQCLQLDLQQWSVLNAAVRQIGSPPRRHRASPAR